MHMTNENVARLDADAAAIVAQHGPVYAYELIKHALGRSHVWDFPLLTVVPAPDTDPEDELFTLKCPHCGALGDSPMEEDYAFRWNDDGEADFDMQTVTYSYQGRGDYGDGVILTQCCRNACQLPEGWATEAS